MSFDIDWAKLDKSVARQVQDILNDNFRRATKPSYIGELRITELDWGTVRPNSPNSGLNVEITSIGDPFPEFYLPDSDDEPEDDEPVRPTPSRSASNINSRNAVSTSMLEENLYPGGTGTPDPPFYPLGPLPSEFNTSSHITATTPPHFHPLNFNALHRSPLVAPQHPFSFPATMGMHSSQSYFPTHLTPSFSSSSFVSHTGSIASSSDIDSLSLSSSPAPLATPQPPGADPIASDVQFQIALTYKGDMRMSIETELRMNYPSVVFMALPIQLTVTAFEFDATAVISYLNERRRINFCFLEPKEEGVTSILRDVHIESVVGDKQKQVLKNVGKIERFVVDQLRKMIDEDLVFPSYHSIELDG
ncbi:hypothetical protein BC938DRAFT_481894 [Jimgerdemannia flammicorona]|nr:hypothetical protein BC938DRAFT_481894 [Jimgerdemannia flammicorona]